MPANFVVKERMQRLYGEYGPEVVESVGRNLIDDSEQRLRRPLENRRHSACDIKSPIEYETDHHLDREQALLASIEAA